VQQRGKTGTWLRLSAAVLEIRSGDNAAHYSVSLQQFKYTTYKFPPAKRLGDKVIKFDIIPRGRRRKP